MKCALAGIIFINVTSAVVARESDRVIKLRRLAGDLVEKISFWWAVLYGRPCNSVIRRRRRRRAEINSSAGGDSRKRQNGSANNSICGEVLKIIMETPFGRADASCGIAHLCLMK